MPIRCRTTGRGVLRRPTGNIGSVAAWTKSLDKPNQFAQLASKLAGTTAEGDLAQLRGMGRRAHLYQWIPTWPDHLSDRVGRQLAPVSQIVLRAAKGALEVKTRAETTDSGPDRLSDEPGSREFSLGWYKAWSDEGRAPVWSSLSPTSAFESLRAPLRALGREASM